MNPVTAAHLHLLLSHFPTTVILVAAAWLAVGLWREKPDLQKGALVMFVAAAVVAVPLYLTGEPASGSVKGTQGFSERILEAHQAAAGIAVAGCGALGLAALAGLIHFRGRALAAWFSILVLVAAAVTGGFAAWTAHLGGQIRHSEIRAEDVSE